MNIGLISDTHILEAMPELPLQIRQIFADTGLILHAGDLHAWRCSIAGGDGASAGGAAMGTVARWSPCRA